MAARMRPVPGNVNRRFAAIATIALAACAATDQAGTTALTESWRGASYDEVAAAWGPPAQSAGASHSWRSGSGTGGGVGMIFSAAGEPVRCDRTLVFRDRRVVDASWSGDPEFCKRLVRRR